MNRILRTILLAFTHLTLLTECLINLLAFKTQQNRLSLQSAHSSKGLLLKYIPDAKSNAPIIDFNNGQKRIRQIITIS